MASKLTIGQLSSTTGVPTSTIRYYERIRLLEASGRSASNYRLYSQEDLERLRFIRTAKATGFTLHDVISLLRPSGCESVQQLIEKRLAEVAARMKELRQVQKVLRTVLGECREHEKTGRCKAIDDLSARSKHLA